MKQRLSLLHIVFAAALVAAGCDGGDLAHPTGEIVIGTNTDRNAVFDFGTVFAGQSVTQKIVVRNMGRGRLPLAALLKTDGVRVKIGDQGDEHPIYTVAFEPTVLSSSEVAEFDVTFTPPETPEPIDYQVVLTLHAENTDDGKDTATITLQGKGIPGICELPKTIDFGNVAIDDTYATGFTIQNPTELPANATVGDVTSSSGDDLAFPFSAESPRGDFTIDPSRQADVTFEFHPTEKKSYLAFVKARASEQCPEQTITLTGHGVDQVLNWTPAQVNCGYVTPGIEVQREITFQNDGNADAEIFAFDLKGSTEFSIVKANDGDTSRLSIAGKGGTATLTISCKPAILGPRATEFRFSSTVPMQRTGNAIPLKVFGGGADIEVKPSPVLNFGRVAYFANAATPTSVSRKLTVMNVGTSPAASDPAANLHLGTDDGFGNFIEPLVEVIPTNPTTEMGEFTVTVPSSYDPAKGLEAKAGLNTADLIVTLTPRSATAKAAEIKIHSNDPDEPVVTIQVTANAVVVPPCHYTVTPTTLNFGLISPPNYRDMAFTIRNDGVAPTDECIISGIDLDSTSHEAFSLPNGPIEELDLGPGEEKQIVVRAWPQGKTPTSVTTITGKVTFSVSSDTEPSAAVLLTAQLAPSCLIIAPDNLDFGTVEIGCSSATRTFNVYNTCSNTVTLTGFSMQAPAGEKAGGPNCPGSTDCPEFSFVQTPPIPTGGIPLDSTTAPVTFQVKYKPINTGADSGAVAISAEQDGAQVTYVVTLHGNGDTQGIQSDVYIQDSKPKADILLVIDDSGSMGPYQQSLASNFEYFMAYATAAKVDYHIAVVTTEAAPPDGSSTHYGKFVFGMNHPEKVLTRSTPDVKDKFAAKVNVGTSGYTEYDADPALAALTPPLVNSDNAGFLRDDAALAIVAITDANDQSPKPSTFYLNGFWNLKGFNRKNQFTFNAIAGFSPACAGQVEAMDSGELASWASQTNGVMDDICTPNWAKTLEALGKIAFGFRTNFFLTSLPDLAKGPIEVRVDGELKDPTDERGATVWTYDPIENSINFEAMYVPEPGQTMEITYHTTCYP